MLCTGGIGLEGPELTPGSAFEELIDKLSSTGAFQGLSVSQELGVRMGLRTS